MWNGPPGYTGPRTFESINTPAIACVSTPPAEPTEAPPSRFSPSNWMTVSLLFGSISSPLATVTVTWVTVLIIA